MLHDNYLEELLDEKEFLDPTKARHSLQLLEDEIERVRSGSHNKPSKSNSPRGFEEEVIKLSEKILLPVTEFPRFNFVGKILGPKGSTLKGIQTSTNSKISILGQGSTRDRQKEEELSESGDAQYDHFKEPLHLLIQTEGPKSEAHGNLAVALAELTRCMGPEEPIRRDNVADIRSPISREPEDRSRISQQPILRFGIPPPGAIIIDQPLNRGGYSRVAVMEGRGIPRPSPHRSINESPERDSYASKGRDINYNRYPDSTRETPPHVKYDKYDKYDNTDSFRLTEKRSAPPGEYPVKKRRDDSYNDQYTSQESDPYCSTAY